MEYEDCDILVGSTDLMPVDLLMASGIDAGQFFWPELDLALLILPKISLEEMSGVQLMNRKDVKYIIKASMIPSILKRLAEGYHIQEIDNKRLAEYKTIYLDTKELEFYHTHMNGKLNHMKMRIRSYVESNLSFLEIKSKSNKGRTRKARIVFDADEGFKKGSAADFISQASGFIAGDLLPVLENDFKRMTLVNNNKSERITIDLNISFKNCLSENSGSISDLAIIEIKQDRFSESLMHKYLSDLRIKKSGISKYCLGIAMTSDYIKKNLYKRKMRYINKIISSK
jgi:hypothetical protein